MAKKKAKTVHSFARLRHYSRDGYISWYVRGGDWDVAQCLVEVKPPWDDNSVMLLDFSIWNERDRAQIVKALETYIKELQACRDVVLTIELEKPKKTKPKKRA